MHHGTINKMTGTVEADETFIGGKARFMHADKREEKIHGRGPMGKAIVFGLLERETGKVRTSVRRYAPEASPSRTDSRERRARCGAEHRRAEVLRRPGRIHAQGCRSREKYVDGNGPHEPAGKLLVAAEALHQGHVREC